MIVTCGLEIYSRQIQFMKGDIIICRNDAVLTKESSAFRELYTYRFKWNGVRSDDEWNRVDKYCLSESKVLSPYCSSYFIPIDSRLYVIVSSGIPNYEIMVSDLYVDEQGVAFYSMHARVGAKRIGKVMQIDVIFVGESTRPIISRFLTYSLEKSLTSDLAGAMNGLLKRDMILISKQMPSCSLYYCIFQEDDFYGMNVKIIFRDVGCNRMETIWNPFICNFSVTIVCYFSLLNMEEKGVKMKQYYYSGDGCSLSLH